MNRNFKQYLGKGNTIGSRGEALPDFTSMVDTELPESYLAGPALANAVNVALALGQPLLLTGEPGTGKTRLAHSIAHELELGKPLEFFTKSTSVATDLFYEYDALSRFQAEEKKPVEHYLSYRALGTAIMLASDPQVADPFLPEVLRGRGPSRSVVLIDEIDKAPRDFPNDILNEIENMSFTVKETGRHFRAQAGKRPILVLTSNSEKNLPNAFLRRCVFCHIPFPGSTDLEDIVNRHFGSLPDFTPVFIERAVAHFAGIRELALKKPPTTAELLAWVRVLRALDLDPADVKPEQKDALLTSYAVLAKSSEDMARLRETMAND